MTTVLTEPMNLGDLLKYEAPQPLTDPKWPPVCCCRTATPT